MENQKKSQIGTWSFQNKLEVRGETLMQQQHSEKSNVLSFSDWTFSILCGVK